MTGLKQQIERANSEQEIAILEETLPRSNNFGNLMKNKTKSKKREHRYFFLVGKIIVFKHGKDGAGRSYHIDGEVGYPWWRLREMETIGAIELPAKLLKKVARL